jgi:hypothetical protein
LKADEWIVVNPPDSLEEGQEVRVKEVAAAESTGPPGRARGGSVASGATR